MSSVRANRHVIGLVRSVGANGATDERALVRCPLRKESVPLDSCRSCKKCMEVRHDRLGVPTSVICRVEVDELGEHDEGKLELPRLSVGSLMTRNVLCVRPELSLDAVIALFVESGFKAVPVVDEYGSLVGIVTEADVLIDVYVHENSDVDRRSVGVDMLGERLHTVPEGRTVGDVMLPLALTLPESASITQAAAVLEFEGFYHVVVLASDDKIVGVLAAADILYHLARSDGFVLPAPRRFGI
jgi:CBS domain-containing protein